MAFWRSKRPGDAAASSGAVAYAQSGNGATHVEDIDERLQRIRDEEAWRNSHTKLVLQYNFASLSFWVLCTASLCFAALNAHHGYVGGIASGIVVATVIAFMYFAIELTIPMSAHWISWSGDGGHKWFVRVIGILGYVLAVTFSLLILQGNFSGAADTADANAKVSSQVFSADTTELAQALKRRDDLAKSVRREPDAIDTEIKSVLATSLSKNETLGERTRDCLGDKRQGRERDLCNKVTTLRLEKGDADSLAKLDARIRELKTGLMTRSEEGKNTNNSDASDVVLSDILNVKLETVKQFKASVLAMIAALVTHLLWGAHGVTVNYAIASRRREHMEVSALQRASDRAKNIQRKTQEELAAEAARRKGLGERVANTLIGAPVAEQPAAMQVQTYITERCIQGEDYSQSIGIIHDDYVAWARAGKLTPLNISRFGEMIKTLGYSIATDGRILQVAIRGGL